MEIALFIAGIACGMEIYRRIIASVVRRGHMVCDYCEFQREKEKIFPKRK